MKFNDLINESTPLKDYKKAELVYDVLKKGKISNSYGERGDAEYRYELSDDKFIKVIEGRLFVFPESITIYKDNELANQVYDLLPVFRSIKKRFSNYNITFNEPKHHTSVTVIKYNPDLINEDFTPNEEQLKELKRAKIVYATFRKGALIFMHYSSKDRKDEDNTVKYKLGEPEYNWYPKNGYKDNMELTVVVKNLTVYIKDPVLYDAIVVNPNRMQDYYGPLVYNYIIPKARRRFEKHKVKLHIGEPIVEFVLVEPEEPKAINEGTLTNKDDKMVNAVYLTLKKGKVKRNEVEGEDPIFAYKLSDEYEAYSKDGELFVSPAGIKIKEMNKAASNGNFMSVFTSLEKRFSNYRINFVKPRMTWDDLISYSFEDASSKEAINEELSDKDIKKCEILWDQFKTGTFTINDKKYRYQLRNEYQIISVPSNPNPIIEIQGTFENSVRVYEMQDNGHNVLLNYEMNNRLYMDVKSKVRNKFNNYNVRLSL